MVAIKTEHNGHRSCLGSLIADSWAVTAAHCFGTRSMADPRNTIKVVAGVYTHSADQVIVHEGFKNATTCIKYGGELCMNDIALVHLERPIPNAMPICLATSKRFPDQYGKCSVGTKAQDQGEANVAYDRYGYGAVPMTLVETFPCDTLAEFKKGIMVCARSQGPRKQCTIDNGAPFQCANTANNNVWYLNGVASYCSRPYTVGVYTRVAKFVDWIRSKTGQ